METVGGSTAGPRHPYSLAHHLIWARTGAVTRMYAGKCGIKAQEFEDLRQEAYLRILRSLDRFDASHGSAKASTWIHTHARGTVLDYLKARKRRIPSVQWPDAHPLDRPDSGDSVLAILEDRERDRIRRECVEELPATLRTRWLARFPHDGASRTLPAVALLLGTTVAALKDSYKVAVPRIVNCMKRKLFPEPPPPSSPASR